MAVTTVVGLFGALTVSNSAELRAFLLTICMLAPESTTNSLVSGFIVDAVGKIHSSVGEKNVAFSFPLKSPRVSAGTSLVSFNLSLRSVLELHSVWTALMRKFDLYFIHRWTFVFSNVCMTYRSSSVVELIPKLWCPSVHSLQTVAARRPAMHNPTVAHFSQQLLHFCHHPSSAFYLVVPQPSSAETSTLCRIYIPILTFKLTFGRMTIVTR